MKIEFNLYVKEENEQIKLFVKRLRKIIYKNCTQDFSLEVISILDNPTVVQKHGIFATPMLIKVWPPPIKKLFCNPNNKLNEKNIKNVFKERY